MKAPNKPVDDGESPINILWLPTILIAGIAYITSMVDLLPDWIIGIGWIDDIIVAMALVWFFTTWLPKNRDRIYWFRPNPRARPRAGQGASGGESGSFEAGSSRGEFDPFAVLELRPGASAGEAKAAYREMLSKYHPDKVSHLGEDFQKIAHEKALDIQKAYEMIVGKE
jgi:hypothetical protein